MNSSGTISVVIRVRNEGLALRKVLCALAAQDIQPMEILVIDNESSDDSRAVAQQYGAKIHQISQAEFTYGRALNLGIRHARGEFVCILSAHSMPIGHDFLRKAIAPFENSKIAAVRCLSVTNRGDLEKWIEPKVLEWPIAIEAVISSAPANCASMIRRSVWEQIPYDETLAGVEDKFWAYQVLESGHRITNSTALYLYLKDPRLGDKIRTLYRDRMEFFRRTGRQWQEPPVSLLQLLSNAFYNIPRRAFRATIYEATLYACLKAIPYQARRERKTN